MDNKRHKQPTLGLAIAGLTCISSALVLLSAVVRADISLLNFLFIISTLVILLGCGYGLTIIKFPAIAKPYRCASFYRNTQPMTVTKNDILFWTGIITAIWFAWTGMVWTYNAALIIAYPIGLTSFFIWRNIKGDNKQRNKFIPNILLVGLILSLSVLVYFLIFD